MNIIAGMLLFGIITFLIGFVIGNNWGWDNGYRTGKDYMKILGGGKSST